MPQYFYQFPIISYSNTNVRDITRRVTIDAKVKNNLDLYYPAEISAGFRADQLSEAYYNDPELDWMIFIMNGVVDPYYEWYISETDFYKFVETKYDSVANAQERIVYYRNNWYEDNAQLTPDQWENIIDPLWKKYYEPVFTPTNKIYAYKRKEEDWVVNTNRILRYDVYYTNTEVQFVNGEIVDIKYSGEIVGGGTVIVANSTHIDVHHVSGNTTANTSAGKEILGETSGANATTNAVATLSENFTTEESRFWSNVSYFDVELEKYEQKKNVQVINGDAVTDLIEDIRILFNENA